MDFEEGAINSFNKVKLIFFGKTHRGNLATHGVLVDEPIVQALIETLCQACQEGMPTGPGAGIQTFQDQNWLGCVIG